MTEKVEVKYAIIGAVASILVLGILAISGIASIASAQNATGGDMTGENMTTGIIQLDVEEQQEVYRWSDNGGAINPTLKFIVNTDNIVQIQNPTDEEHEMIIESQPGNELATSGDIEPSGSGELSFRPNMTGTFQYHCEYHPATMKGPVEISGG
jgi:hypothetical protein